ncbi:MAG: hypothetical protein QNI90_15850 [Dinoroseobacter sp.]|nr:hypothetical protein [Dinoroseobacter sp.]
MKQLISRTIGVIAFFIVFSSNIVAVYAEDSQSLFRLPGVFSDLRIADNGRIFLAINNDRSILSITTRDSGKTVEWKHEATKVVDAFFWSDLILVLAKDGSNSNDISATRGRIFLLKADGSQVAEQGVNVDTGDEAVLLATGELYVLDSDRRTISMVPLCRDQLAFASVCNFSRREVSGELSLGGREEYNTFFSPNLGRIDDFVVDPFSNLLIVTSPRQLTGFDLRNQRLLFELFSEEEGRPSIVSDITPEATQFFVTDDRNGIFSFQFNRDFRDLLREGSITVDAGAVEDIRLLDVVGSVSGFTPDTTHSSKQPSRAVDASAGQKVVIIATSSFGVSDALRVLSREGRFFVKRFSLSLLGGAIPDDFAVSQDGEEIFLLFGNTVIVLPFREFSDLAEVATSNAGLNLAVILQTSLSEAGFFQGVADGEWGETSQNALLRYCLTNAGQVCPASTPEKTDPNILAGLLIGRLDDWDRADLSRDISDQVSFSAFERFFDLVFPNSPFFRAEEIVSNGAAKDAYKRECYSLNTFPPESIWPNILPALSDLQRVRASVGVPIIINSTYQTPEFSSCKKTAVDPELHASFSAIDFRFAQGGASLPEAIQRALSDPNVVRFSDVKETPTGFLLAFPPDRIPEIGSTQAQISAYRPTTDGCREAKEDVEEFSRLLSDTVLSGRVISVLRKRLADVYAVSVDLSDVGLRTEEALAAIRNAALSSTDRRTGRDAFIATNRGSFIDPNCSSQLTVP